MVALQQAGVLRHLPRSCSMLLEELNTRRLFACKAALGDAKLGSTTCDHAKQHTTTLISTRQP